ncbi:MAG: S9 family peptidase [Chloroflexota bacterium]
MGLKQALPSGRGKKRWLSIWKKEARNNMEPPIAPKIPHKIITHGHTRTDDYFWMRQKDRSELLDYIHAENAFTQAGMAHTKELQETLYAEMIGRIQETDQSVPYEKGGYFYYSRTEEGLQYMIYCRKKGSMQADEEILLDPNAIAKEVEGDYLKVGIFDVSPDQKTLAYSLDTTGGERYTIYFKNLETGKLRPDTVENVGYDFEWANDSQTVFFDRLDDAWRSNQIWRFTMGDGDPDSTLIFQEDDEEFSVGLGKTRDDRFIQLLVDAAETSEVYLLDANDPLSDLRLTADRMTGVDYSVQHRNGLLYILTNSDSATNFKLVTVDASDPGRENWQDFISHRPDVRLSYVSLFADHMVMLERENGLERFVVHHFSDGSQVEIPMNEPIYAIGHGINPNFETASFRYVYGSLSTPDSVMLYDFGAGESTLLKQDPVPSYDPSLYETERIWAPADDGKLVPVSVVYKKGMVRTGDNPALLYGYGSYGVNIDPDFRSTWISLLDRGFVCAIAHIRGSETLGRPWYDDGKLLNKRNTFTDFIAAGKHLVTMGYTQPENLAIWGRSAGGLLMGSVLNLAPDMAAAAIADVPFVDVISTMLDESIPLTVGEFREWGNPKVEAYYHYMLGYSPYDNVEAKVYPAILVTSGYNDPRVQYWEPTKWVAKLRDLKTDDNPVYLQTNMGAGHSGSTGRYDYLKEYAFRLAFLIDQVGND